MRVGARVRLTVFTTAVMAAGACLSLPPARVEPVLYRGEVTESGSDAVVDPRVPRAPDLVSAAVEVGPADVAFHIHFEPASYRADAIDITVQLDTDLSPGTGTRIGPAFGMDYAINAGRLFHHNDYSVSRVAPGECLEPRGGCFIKTGSGPVRFLDDGMEFLVPRAALGRFSGEFTFRVLAYVKPVGAQFSIVTDQIPNAGAAPARVR